MTFCSSHYTTIYCFTYDVFFKSSKIIYSKYKSFSRIFQDWLIFNDFEYAYSYYH